MIIKCKMCGGDLSFTEGSTVCECEFCGSQQTVPALDNEKKMNLFNRANRLRMNAEFDKAATVYASITAEFPEEAEAYWGLCLCKYGIEYVDDPATGNKIPTCHRTLPESIMDDSDFDQACENADPIAKKLYREEAKAIDRLQRNILDIVAKETPYDVFICYKESDENGNRTEDSVLSQDIYDALTGKGLKVFFARITLEDKLGQQYEPYIYAALHSAKVMLAIGTQFDYFDAVWVKNEWARFLDMMKSDRSKTLIPCYKGIDAYDMPREFKNLQAQDMGKLGWLQDLTRGVMKLCGKDDNANTQLSSKTVIQQVVQGGNPTVDSLLQRAFLFLEDGDWESAKEYSERVLDIDPVNANGYLGRLLAEMKAKNPEELIQQKMFFEENSNYQKLIRFGDNSTKEHARTWVQMRDSKIEHDRQEDVFKSAMLKLEAASTAEAYMSVRKLLESISNYEGVQEAIAECDEKRYGIALYAMEINKWDEAQKEFDSLNDYKDSKELAQLCREKRNEEIYKNGLEFKARKEWDRAIVEFSALGDYQDSEMQVKECRAEKEARDECRRKVLAIYKSYYQTCSENVHRKQEEKQRELATLHGMFVGNKRAALQRLIEECKAEERRIQRILVEGGDKIQTFQKSITLENDSAKETLYNIGRIYVESKMYEEAFLTFQKIRGFRNVDSLIHNDENLAALELKDPYKRFRTVGETVTFGQYKQDNIIGDGEKTVEWIVLDSDGTRSLLISKYGLDTKPYNEQNTSITWEECTLRTWLNDTFMRNAFSSEERKAILTTSVDNSFAQGYSGYDTRGGNDTQDKIFLLSYAEAWKYFKSDNDRTCTTTAYANSQGAYKANNGNCWWWLRSPGNYQNVVAYIFENGALSDHLPYIMCISIRPAFWLNLKALSC